MQDEHLSMESKINFFQKKLSLYEDRNYNNIPCFKHEEYYCF